MVKIMQYSIKTKFYFICRKSMEISLVLHFYFLQPYVLKHTTFDFLIKF